MANALFLGADTQFNCDLEGQLGEVIDEERQTACVATLRLGVVLLIIWIPAFVNLHGTASRKAGTMISTWAYDSELELTHQGRYVNRQHYTYPFPYSEIDLSQLALQLALQIVVGLLCSKAPKVEHRDCRFDGFSLIGRNQMEVGSVLWTKPRLVCGPSVDWIPSCRWSLRSLFAPSLQALCVLEAACQPILPLAIKMFKIVIHYSTIVLNAHIYTTDYCNNRWNLHKFHVGLLEV